MSKKRHLILCLDIKEHRQLTAAADHLNISVEELVSKAIEEKMTALFAGENHDYHNK